MPVWALGLNHNTAPLDLRGRFAYALDQVEPTLRGLRASLARQSEAALLSTCNRTEIYCAGEHNDLDHTLEWLAHSGGVSPALLRSHAYTLQDDLAARHAFRVASGLDSMVLGEPQILGQLKDAVRAAEDAGAMGSTLHQLFQRSFAVAKEVRSSTEIGAHSISMAAAAVRLAGQLFEDLGEIKVLFVGAGEMIDLAATHFAAKNPKAMAIANRTLERGEKLASRFGAEVMRLADLPSRLHEFDAVISCTASTLPIIGLGAVERAVKLRKHRPMFMVDLAVPRDIELEVKALPDIYLYTVDDLAQVVQTGKDSRQAAVAQAEVIIDAGVQNFMHWLGQRRSVPLIQQLNAQIKELKSRGDPARAQLEQTIKSISTFLDLLANQQQQAKTPNTELILFVAQSYSSLDKHAVAAELASKVVQPLPEAGKKEPDPKALGLYYGAQIVVARELRMAAAQSDNKDFAKAKQALDQILNTAWGKRSIDVQIERVKLLEDQGQYLLPNRAGAIHEWNKLMQSMRPRLADNKIMEQYFDCYYHLAWCIYKNALKIPDARQRKQGVQQAAKYIVRFENQQDTAAEICKKRFQELLEQEPALKTQYDELKKAGS